MERIFSFSKKIKDGEVRLGTLGDALSSLLVELLVAFFGLVSRS